MDPGGGTIRAMPHPRTSENGTNRLSYLSIFLNKGNYLEKFRLLCLLGRKEAKSDECSEIGVG